MLKSSRKTVEQRQFLFASLILPFWDVMAKLQRHLQYWSIYLRYKSVSLKKSPKWPLSCKNMATVRQVEANKSKCSSKCWFHWRGCLNLRRGSVWLPKNWSLSHQMLYFLTLLYNHTWVINHSSASLNRLPFVSTWKYMKCAWADGARISVIERSMGNNGKASFNITRSSHTS